MVKLKQLAYALTTAAILSIGSNAHSEAAPLYTQNFDGVTQGGGVAGITVLNRSTLPTDQWGGGNSAIFGAQSGAVGSYFADSFASTAGPTGAISDWLLTPLMTIANNYVFSFYAQSAGGDFPDSLQLRLCTASPCTNVGASATDVGSFTTLLLNINPTFTTTGFPTTWTQFTATVTGLTGSVSGRFGLRYFVSDVSTQGNYIGVDSISISAVPEPESMLLIALGLSAMGIALRRKARK